MAKKSKNQPNIHEQSGVVVDSKKKKKGGGGLVVILLVLFFIIIIAAAVLAFMFNWFSIKQKVVDMVMGMDQGYVQEVLQNAENTAAQASEAERLAKEAQAQYEKRLADLDAREQKIAQAEANLAAAQDEVLNTSQTPAEKRTSLISMFENMDRASAASALEQINDVNTVAGILSEMKKKAAAEIMDKFTPEFAAAVAKAML